MPTINTAALSRSGNLRAGILRVILATTLITPGGLTTAQPYPLRPIRLVAPFWAGGGTDISSRVVAQKLAQRPGTGIVVDNRSGAGGIVGADLVAKSQPIQKIAIYTEVVGAVHKDEVRDRLMGLGLEPEPAASTPEELTLRINEEIDKWRRVIKVAGIMPQ